MSEANPGKYELVAELWDRYLSEPGKPFDFERFRKGDIVELNVEEARRLVAAGAVIEPGARERAAYQAAKAAYEAAAALLPPDPDAADEPAEEPAASAEPTTVGEPAPGGAKPVAEMKLAELRDHAQAEGIDLTGVDLRKIKEVRTAVLQASQA